MKASSIVIIIVAIPLLAVVIFYAIRQLKKIAAQKRIAAERLEKERQEQERIRLAVEEANRLKEKEIVEQMFPALLKAYESFQHFLSFTDGYFNNNKLRGWKASVADLYNELKKYPIKKLQLEPLVASTIQGFQTSYDGAEKIRNDFNRNFIQKELKECSALLSNIEGRPLDEQQRTAVIKDEDHNLVIAGAGSGKTTTVAGKVAYVINRLRVKAEEILLITFTKKASDEMKHRIRLKMNIDIDVHTFHSFGRKVIGQATNNMPSVIEEKAFYTLMKRIFESLLKDPAYVGKVIKFITEYRLEAKDENEFKSHGEYIDYLKDKNIRSYKTVEVVIKGKPTMLREYCKSLEEVQIANFLFLNTVNYQYEAPYKIKTSDSVYAQYKPDFYLPDYDIYIEHFGLTDRDNNVPNWFSSDRGITAKEKYNAGIEWKRKLHADNQTQLVETYSYENKEGLLLEKLKEKLEAKGVVFKPRSNEEIWKILNTVAKDEVSALETLIYTFLNLFKSNNFEIAQVREQVDSSRDAKVKARYLLFLEIFFPILTTYNEFLKSKNLIDFSDMINDATRYITEGKVKNRFKYIIIDEFQDTSIGRFGLIKALLKDNSACKLFAVGDDWQSIYRFAGSDISLFTQFEKYFGVTEFSKIETTYRFSKSMIDISSRFILTNPNQTPKHLKSFASDTVHPLEIITSDSFNNDDPFPLLTALEKINQENAASGNTPTILALARYNHFINLYKERTDLFRVTYNEAEGNYSIKCLSMPHLSIQFLSVHRSKGLQADYVILLNCVSGQYGFPSEHADDPILNLLLSKADQFDNGEERRLFYVALTRSKRKTFITTSTVYRSKFIDEIDPSFTPAPSDLCPVCKKGNRIKQEGTNRNGKAYVKYSCSNWKFGCGYLAWG